MCILLHGALHNVFDHLNIPQPSCLQVSRLKKINKLHFRIMTATPQSSLAVAVALWGKKPPKHRINCLQCFKNGAVIITGKSSGQIQQHIIHESCENSDGHS